jgi:hypothetical protein
VLTGFEWHTRVDPAWESVSNRTRAWWGQELHCHFWCNRNTDISWNRLRITSQIACRVQVPRHDAHACCERSLVASLPHHHNCAIPYCVMMVDSMLFLCSKNFFLGACVKTCRCSCCAPAYQARHAKYAGSACFAMRCNVRLRIAHAASRA